MQLDWAIFIVVIVCILVLLLAVQIQARQLRTELQDIKELLKALREKKS